MMKLKSAKKYKSMKLFFHALERRPKSKNWSMPKKLMKLY